MAAEQKAGAAATATEFAPEDWVKNALTKFPKPSDDKAKARDEATLKGFIEAALDPKNKFDKNVVASVKSWINLLDQKLTAQMNEVMHHPDFQKLEAAWRGLYYLVDKTETGSKMKIRVLNATQKEVQTDLEDAGDSFHLSETYKKIHDEEYGRLGGNPYGMMVGDYSFDCRNTMDVAFVKGIARVAAASHCPFVAAVSAQAFGMESYTELPGRNSLGKGMLDTDNVQYAEWRAFRDSADSRYVALTCPRVLARQVYGEKFRPVSAFRFEEQVDGTNHDKYLWMSAAWAYAARVTDAYSRYGWMAATRGVEGGGKVEGLPVHTFDTEYGDVAMKCPSEVVITDAKEKELDTLGFISLVHYKNTGTAAFMSGVSCQRPLKYDGADANANSKLSSMFNLMLCVSRFAHMLKVIVRNRVGAFEERDTLERKLNTWILRYVEPNPSTATDAMKARKPLKWAKVAVEAVAGEPGVYTAVAHMCPHTQLEGLDLSMRLVAGPRTK